MPDRRQEQAHAKLTRSLRVLGRDSGGLHRLEAEMITLDLHDDLEISEGDGLEVVDEVFWRGRKQSTGNSPVEVPNDQSNLVKRALEAAGRQAFVRLVKRIPAAGGLGGGSADAAAVLRWAGVSDGAVAASVGSDVPFCVRGGRARVTGTGDVVEPLPFEEVHVVLVTPRFGVSTAAAYAMWDEMGGPRSETGNDLEPAALLADPRLEWWRSFLESVAGRPPLLAGSGSSWFFEEPTSESAKTLGDLIALSVDTAGTRAFVMSCRSVSPAEGSSLA